MTAGSVGGKPESGLDIARSSSTRASRGIARNLGHHREVRWRPALRYPPGMATRAGDWFRQAEADLAHARHAIDGGHHEWACFAAQQAAEKAVKAAHQALGQDAWGHSVTELLQALQGQVAAVGEPLLDRARALDKLYVPTRYPNGLPSGAPADYYTRTEAERAIADAEAILACCRGVLSR